MAKRRSERGFALPMTIFLVALLTVLLATAFARASSDHEVASSGSTAIRAQMLAENGLVTYIDTLTSRPDDGDSVRINVAGGYAEVVARVLQNPADTTEDEIFVIRSTGYVIDPNQGTTPIGQHTVARIALWQVGKIKRNAALVAPNGVTVIPPADVIVDGRDGSVCGAADIAGARLASQATPNGTYSGSPPTWIGETPDSVAYETEIDWQLIVSGEFTYDYTGLATMTDSSSYYIDGDLTLIADGEGLLIVTGDLITDTGFKRWNGIVLVGGKITFGSKENSFHGMVATGLNEQVSFIPVGQNRMIDATGKYRFLYDSCNVDNALKGLTGLVPINNAWIDNWAMY